MDDSIRDWVLDSNKPESVQDVIKDSKRLKYENEADHALAGFSIKLSGRFGFNGGRLTPNKNYNTKRK